MLQKRIIPVVTALMFAFAVWFAVTAAASGNNQPGAQMRYVIVVDASKKSDPGEVCAAACETFLDALPGNNAQIGVIAYGYTSSEEDGYSYSSTAKPTVDTEYIHQLLPLSQAGTVDGPVLAANIQQAFGANQQLSPHGHALLAGVDMLVSAGTPAGNGCIILLSDGIKTSSESQTEHDCRYQAAELAAENQWPIHVVHLDYDPNEEKNNQAAIDLLKELTKMTEGADGKPAQYQSVEMHPVLGNDPQNSSPLEDLRGALLTLLPGKYSKEPAQNGEMTVFCPVQNFTYEYVVGFFGSSVDAVSVEASDADPIIYTESRDDGDIAVTRGEDYFIIHLRFPIPENWTIQAQGVGENVHIYRSVYRAVDIDLVVEDEDAQALLSGDARNMELDRGGKLFFMSSYGYHGHPLDISGTDHSMTAKLEIQVKRPGDNSLYRKLDIIELKPDGEGHRTKKEIALSGLLQAELDQYDAQTKKYRARVVLEWEEDGLQQQYGEWFAFGIKDTPIEHLSEEPLDGISVPANSLIRIPLETCIRNEDGDLLEFELVVKEGHPDDFTLTDEDGNPLEEPAEGKVNNVWINVGCYVGSYELSVRVNDGQSRKIVTLPVKVLPYPEPEDEQVPVIELELNDVPPFVKWLDSLFGIPIDSPEYRKIMGEEVHDVHVAGKDADRVSWFYNKDSRELRILPKAEGPIELELLVEYNALELQPNGEYTAQTQNRPLELRATSRWGQMVWTGLTWGVCFLVISFVVCRVVLSKRKFPPNMTCTMKFLGPDPEQDNPLVATSLFLQGCPADGFADNACSISVEKLILYLIKNGSEVENRNSIQNLPDINKIRTWFNNRSDILENTRLEKICLKGTISDKTMCRITGLHGNHDDVNAEVYSLGNDQRPKKVGLFGIIPASRCLIITVDVSASTAGSGPDHIPCEQIALEIKAAP